ncbi:hypothetical protein ABDE16_02470 [Streptomyces sp. BRB040]|uniref:hypothetical protein n=1 Tax=Streptomyces sp. BRB040 TaxID=3142634 RepID=UPI0031F6DB6F
MGAPGPLGIPVPLRFPDLLSTLDPLDSPDLRPRWAPGPRGSYGWVSGAAALG